MTIDDGNVNLGTFTMVFILNDENDDFSNGCRVNFGPKGDNVP